MPPKRLGITLLSGVIIVGVSLLAIQFAKGYRPTRRGAVKGTGLLAANSFPNGAQVYINSKLTTATDNTLNLDPGTYSVEIKKDGFHSWQKNIKIEQELVVQTNATLYPLVPSLTPLSFWGVQNVLPSPDGQRLAFMVASGSSTLRDGVYVLDLSDNFLSLQKGPKQIITISNASEMKEISRARKLWAPDGSGILFNLDSRYLLADPDKTQAWTDLKDVSVNSTQLLQEWQDEFAKRRGTRLKKFPIAVQNIATASASTYYVSPDDNLLLYTATASASLAENLLPPVQAASTQPQTRQIEPGNVYIYDSREDRNFLVGRAPEAISLSAVLPSPAPTLKSKLRNSKISLAEPKLVSTPVDPFAELNQAYTPALQGSWQWFPDSRHVLGFDSGSVVVKEYDGQNQTTVYGGPHSGNFVYPWPNGSKIVVLANFSTDADTLPNLYAIALR